MTSNTDDSAPKSASQKLAELVAQRKASGARSNIKINTGQQGAERAAAARSASKSKPAPRKG